MKSLQSKPDVKKVSTLPKKVALGYQEFMVQKKKIVKIIPNQPKIEYLEQKLVQ